MRAVLPSDKTNSARTMNYKSLALGSRALSLSLAYPQTHSPEHSRAEKWEIIYGSLFARAHSFEL
jgi:hypothetical protein